MPQLPSARRWARLIADRKRAGQLVKLSKAEQAEVRKLIDENKGREARERLTELDADRRNRQRLKKQLYRIDKMSKSERKGKRFFAHESQANIEIMRDLYRQSRT